MRTYVASRQAHSALGRLLRPWFKAHGWDKRPGGTAAFTRQSSEGPGFWCLWFQVSQWGNADFGNEFTLNLVLQQSEAASLCGGPHARVLNTLSPQAREEGLGIETAIVARIPKPPPGRKIYEWMEADDPYAAHHRQAWQRAFSPDVRRWRQPGVDLWLRYFSVDDVEDWAAFLLPRLEGLTAQANKGMGASG